MKPPAFAYLRADAVEEVHDTLAEHGDEARVLAGGQSLLPMLNMRLARPAIVVDINHIDALHVLRERGGCIEVGPAATQAELGRWPALATHAPLLARALPHVGHFQTRNRGTVCGSIAHADPSAELALCLATLGGEVVLSSRSGTRMLTADTFQTGILETARAPEELIERVRFPLSAPGTGFAFTR